MKSRKNHTQSAALHRSKLTACRQLICVSAASLIRCRQARTIGARSTTMRLRVTRQVAHGPQRPAARRTAARLVTVRAGRLAGRDRPPVALARQAAAAGPGTRRRHSLSDRPARVPVPSVQQAAGARAGVHTRNAKVARSACRNDSPRSRRDFPDGHVRAAQARADRPEGRRWQTRRQVGGWRAASQDSTLATSAMSSGWRAESR